MCYMCSFASYADVFEGFDAPGDTSSTYVINSGDTFYGTLGFNNFDFIGLNIVAGQTYDIFLTGEGLTNGIEDPFMGLVDPFNNVVAIDDDSGPNLSSYLNYTATYTGVIYIVADTYTSEETGTYSITVTNGTPPPPPPVGTFAEMAEYLTDGHWEETFESRHVFDTSTSNVITVDITSLTAAGQQLARWAFEAWEMVANIDFVEVTFNADLEFIDTDGGAYSSYTASGGITTSSLVNVSQTDWVDFYGTTLDSYSFSTYIHEIGHALGLGHMGGYNGSANYATDATFANDSLQLSIMSYFQNSENPTTIASDTENLTAQLVDILAVQDLYGAASGGVTAGNTTYGAGSSLGNYLDTVFNAFVTGDFTGDYQGGPISITIYDEDGIDTVDLSFDNINDQTVNLNAGEFSDVGGLIGNVGIAIGTVLENLITGAGFDVVFTNGADNMVMTGAGNDTVNASDGYDTLYGGADDDTLIFDFDFAAVTSGSTSGTMVFLDAGSVVVDAYDFEFFSFTDALYTFADMVTAFPGGPSIINGTNNSDLNLLGTSGDDTIDGMGRSDSIIAFGGNDSVLGGNGSDTLVGGTGDDVVKGGNGNDVIEGNAGNDTLAGNKGNDEIFGGGNADDINGGAGRDTLSGGSGDDILSGRFGNDELLGGAGNDTLFGDSEDDLLSGGNDNDRLIGGSGRDTLNGDDGDDELIGQSGSDTLNGGDGNDELIGDDGFDLLDGGNDNDTLSGGLRSDTLLGGAGDDTLNGDEGRDTLDGGDGNDLVQGGLGKDTMTGGAGDDTLVGGADNDQFIFTAGNDEITDFEDNVDKIFLTGTAPVGYSAMADNLADFFSVSNGNLVLTIDANTSLQINGYTDVNLVLDDIVIAFA